MTSSISRRTLVRGAAWSAPVVAASATIPAFAASQNLCDLTAKIWVDDTFYYGESGPDQATGAPITKTDMFWTLDQINIEVLGLNENETVANVHVNWYVKTMSRDDDLTVVPTGFYPFLEANSVNEGIVNPGWTSYGFSSPTSVTLTQNNQSVTADMWALEYLNRTGVGAYIPDSTGCTNYKTQVLSSPVRVDYTDVPALQFTAKQIYIPNWGIQATIKTSNDRTITIDGYMWEGGPDNGGFGGIDYVVK